MIYRRILLLLIALAVLVAFSAAAAWVVSTERMETPITLLQFSSGAELEVRNYGEVLYWYPERMINRYSSSRESLSLVHCRTVVLWSVSIAILCIVFRIALGRR